MYINSEIRKQIFKEYSAQSTEKDTGSVQSQIALFTYRIQALNEHMKQHKKDKHTKAGLLKLVGKRRKLLAYLREKDIQAFRELTDRLNIRR